MGKGTNPCHPSLLCVNMHGFMLTPLSDLYTIMSVKKFFIPLAHLIVAGLLCQCTTDAPPLPGSVHLRNPEANKLLNKAKKEAQKGDWKDAIDYYEEIVEDYPLSLEAPRARYNMGELYEKNGRYADAFKQYQELIDRHPDSPLYTKTLERQKNMAFSAANGTLTTEVVWLFEVPISPTYVTEWLTKVKENAPYAPSAAQAMNVLGNYHSNQDKIDEAIKAYQTIVDDYQTSPLAAPAQLKIAKLYHQASEKGDRNPINITRAQEAYEDYLQRYPNSSKAGSIRNNLADIERLIVEQQLDIAEYYLLKMKDIPAATFCYQEVASKAKIHPKAAAKAKARLKELKSAAK